jgi:hypothetical protein
VRVYFLCGSSRLFAFLKYLLDARGLIDTRAHAREIAGRGPLVRLLRDNMSDEFVYRDSDFHFRSVRRRFSISLYGLMKFSRVPTPP